MNFKYIPQHDNKDCGAACLSMIANYYGMKRPFSFYRELTKTDCRGTNILGMVDSGDRIGFSSQAMEGSPDEMIEEIRKGNISLPLVVHTSLDSSAFHYIVIYKYNNGFFYICDPANGKKKLSISDLTYIWTGYIITYSKTPEFVPGNDKRSKNKFMMLLKGQYVKLIGIILISFIIAIIGVAGAYLFEVVIDKFTVNAQSTQTTINGHGANEILDDTLKDDNEDKNILIKFLELVVNETPNFKLLFLMVLFLYILQCFIQYIRGVLIAAVSRKIDVDLSLKYYHHLVHMPVFSVKTRQTGEYMSRLSDVSIVRTAISQATLIIILDATMVIGCGGMLLKESAKLFAVSMIVVIIYALIVIIYKRPIENSNRKVMQSNSCVQSYLKESIDGIETIKSANVTNDIKEKANIKIKKYADLAYKYSLISASQDTLTQAVELIGTLCVLWIGCYMALRREISVGELMTYYALMSYFTEPVKNLIDLQPIVQSAVVAADRLNDILDMTTEEEHEKTSKLLDIKSWSFNNVNFRYGNYDLVLNNINFEIKQGEKIAFVGESGCGKTTIAKLLLRFYNPESGTIAADGINIENISLSSIRDSVGYVDQNTFLFSDTIKNNIKLSNPNANDEAIIAACKLCCVHDFIDTLPLGYDTPLDENGMMLSGGQRQRIAIARAILKHSQLLILDEATSNLDVETECAIKESIFNIQSNLTCIIIAHRLGIIKQCDRIYVMDNGRIVEFGSHEELIKANGKYAKLVQNQF